MNFIEKALNKGKLLVVIENKISKKSLKER